MKVIVLAGGKGTRLFPLSTPERPKQFLPLVDEKPLLVNTIERFLPICGQNDIVVITGENYRGITSDILRVNGFNNVHIVCEPCGRNTAPAIALAVRFIKDILGAQDGEKIFVVPSDHIIKPLELYISSVVQLMDYIESYNIVLLGILPSFPNTQYGYIKSAAGNDIKKIISFKEKPDFKTASNYINEGGYYWNAGMFGFTLGAMEQELRLELPELYKKYNMGLDALLKDFALLTPISIDCGIMEKTQSAAVLPLSCIWSDIGSWKAYYEFCEKDINYNVVYGDAEVSDCTGCLIFSQGQQLIIKGQIGKIIIAVNNSVFVDNL